MRYVVLHHTGWEHDHFDLLLETSADGPLASYRLADWPPIATTIASPNAPHRRAYLDYDGPISGGRGVVVRVAGGNYAQIGEAGGSEIVLHDSGIRLKLPGCGNI